ncbi:hypothetical protein AYI69_g7812 [Smittium culicis]|uniref:Uncharacterized protein n=1 Tax=Smittium culicis TaxID=133412 RepID=A0A1R1XPH3_9FUNG|nr:hypothetical protein AYI69_g7812 [Smittium culicis]
MSQDSSTIKMVKLTFSTRDPEDCKTEVTEAQITTKPVEESKIIGDTEASANDETVKAKPSTIKNQSRIVGLKKKPAS